MAGILLSYWDGLFSGAMLVSGRVFFGWSTLSHHPWEIGQKPWQRSRTCPTRGAWYPYVFPDMVRRSMVRYSLLGVRWGETPWEARNLHHWKLTWRWRIPVFNRIHTSSFMVGFPSSHDSSMGGNIEESYNPGFWWMFSLIKHHLKESRVQQSSTNHPYHHVQ